MSGGGTQSVLHSDALENINCMLDGRKQIIMIDTVSLHWADSNEKVFFVVNHALLKCQLRETLGLINVSVDMNISLQNVTI